MTPTSSDEEEPELSRKAIDLPLVFQCGKCNIIIGDSLKCSNIQAGSITLDSVTDNVKLGETLVRCTKGWDIGCAYLVVGCANCGEHLGKMYKVTLRQLDDIRDKYTLRVDRCQVYHCGGGGGIGRKQQQQQQPVVDVAQIQLRLNIHLQLRKEFQQLQELVVEMNERIAAVEKVLPVQESREEESDVEGEVNLLQSGDGSVKRVKKGGVCVITQHVCTHACLNQGV